MTSSFHRSLALRGLLGGALLCVVGASWSGAAIAAEAGRGHRMAVPRMAAPRVDRDELRAARQAERAQQRAAARGSKQRDLTMQRIPEPELPRQFVPVPLAPLPGPAPATRPGRLTPDERRALRQQINEAGRDVYRPGGP